MGWERGGGPEWVYKVMEARVSLQDGEVMLRHRRSNSLVCNRAGQCATYSNLLWLV